MWVIFARWRIPFLCSAEEMKKTIAILQSNYIPWKGYFDIINRVDEFILYDEVQFTKRDWRNRNFIKTSQGLHCLTIPVLTKGKYDQTIWETHISDSVWAKTHWETIKRAYGKAKYFKEFQQEFEVFFLEKALHIESLSQINFEIINIINRIFEIDTPVLWSHTYTSDGHKSDKLLGICLQASATHYLSGPAAKCYLDEALFKRYGVEVLWMDYMGYPEYSQSYPPFEHGVSVIDLIFNEGPSAQKYMKGSR